MNSVGAENTRDETLRHKFVSKGYFASLTNVPFNLFVSLKFKTLNFVKDLFVNVESFC